MTLDEFKDNVRVKHYYGLKNKMAVKGFKNIYNHSCEVGNIAIEIANKLSFPELEQAILQIAALSHDICKIHGDNHAIVAASLVRQEGELCYDIKNLLLDEYQIRPTEEILDVIAFVVENHSKMDRIINNHPNEQKCRLALVLYAADKIDKFRKCRKKGEIYLPEQFCERMDDAYGIISKENFPVDEDIKQTIQIIMERHR